MIRIAYYSLKLKDPEDLKKGVTKKNMPEAMIALKTVLSLELKFFSKIKNLARILNFQQR